ncbi:hypothetical protein [Micromonospora halophytica]|uniref:Uncharacterized protein n=1 Tax=Micromonospora halophytica TaxID=47864 RepID=A0A1C5HJY4_9ACTN|nr:hypothetical protein [Micromonospora halophytica]SCG46304.1 hypothetical protein GA0070560_104322 [Micromonospora halophytica]
MPATVDPAGRITSWPSRPEWTGLDLDASLPVPQAVASGPATLHRAGRLRGADVTFESLHGAVALARLIAPPPARPA